MSWASKNIFDPLKAFFGGNANPQVQSVSDALTNAGNAIGAALPVLAADAANVAMSKAPPVVQGFEGLADAFIEETITALLSNHSNPTAAKAAIAGS